MRHLRSGVRGRSADGEFAGLLHAGGDGTQRAADNAAAAAAAPRRPGSVSREALLATWKRRRRNWRRGGYAEVAAAVRQLANNLDEHLLICRGGPTLTALEDKMAALARTRRR